MPIDYKKYDPSWKTVIRPDILERANNCCEFCRVENGEQILRGHYLGREVYQLMDGAILDASNSKLIAYNYIGEVCPNDSSTKFIKIVLTIAHLDHNVENNDYSNLKALCQKCHLNWDKEHHRKTRKKNKGLQEIQFPEN
jgi:hypothetical protein